MSHFASKTNYAFYQTVLKGLAVLAVLAFLSFRAYQLSGVYLSVLIHKIKDACGCESMAQFFSMHPDIFRAVILFGIGMGIFVLYSLYKLFILNSQTKKYIAHYLSLARAEHSEKLKAAIKGLDMEEAKIIETDNPSLTVFCFGFWRPKICISRELVDILDNSELKAVLSHETQHMNSHEPLKIFVVKYIRNIFFFLPGLRSSVKKYITFSELAADEKASGNSAARSSLASAILKIAEHEQYQLKQGAPLSYFSSSIEERASRLSDEAYNLEFKFLDKSLIVGSLGMVVVSLLFIFIFSTGAKAFEMHRIENCITPAAPKTDLVCSLAGGENILDIGKNSFQNINNADIEQHSSCKAE